MFLDIICVYGKRLRMKSAFNKKNPHPDPNGIVNQQKGYTHFHKAIVNGDVEAVSWMLKNGADLLQQTGSEKATNLGINKPVTALYLAVKIGRFDIFQMICEQAISRSPEVLSQVINQKLRGSLGNGMPTVLFSAISNRNSEILEYLIDIGADLNITNKAGQNALSWAANTGDIKNLRLLIEKGHMSVNEEGALLLSSTISTGGISTGSDIENIKLLVSMGADINVTDKDGMTPLMLSLQCRVDEFSEFLLDKGAKIDGCAHDGTSLLHLTANKALMQKILNQGGRKYLEQKNKRGHTPLLSAIYKGNTQTAKLLIAEGADIHAVCDRDGANAMNYAAMHGNIELVKNLIDKCVDTSKVSDKFLLPIEDAANRNYGEVVSLLLDAGAGEHVDHIKDGMDLNLLFSNALSGCTPFIKFLIEEKGFDVNAQDEMGRTALHMASSRGNFECIEFLFKCGATANLTDQNGATALHYLATDMDAKHDQKLLINAIDYLIARGVNPAARRRDNMDMAKDRRVQGLEDNVQKYLERVTRDYMRSNPVGLCPPSSP